MAVKWSYPGIGFSEIDNSIQANTTVDDGVGAIVLNANKGYVNQRVLSTSVKKFHENFGDPETDHDYGHFAADQYLVASPALYAVRATMGDEQYAFIQYPYSDASVIDCKVNSLVQKFEYVDNNGDTQIKLLDPMNSHVQFESISALNWQTFKTNTTAEDVNADNYTNTAFCLVDNGYAVYYKDLQYEQDPAITVIRDDFVDGKIKDENKGTYYAIASLDGGSNNKLFMKKPAGYDVEKVLVYSPDGETPQGVDNHPSLYVNSAQTYEDADEVYWKVQLSVPKNLTLNNTENFAADFYIPSATVSEYASDELLVSDILADAIDGTIAESADVYAVRFFNWQTEEYNNLEIIEQSAYDNKSSVSGIQYREITGALYNQQLIMSKPNSALSGNIHVESVDMTLDMLSAANPAQYEHYKAVAEAGIITSVADTLDPEIVKSLAYDKYSKDLAEVYTSAYSVVEFLEPTQQEIQSIIIFNDNPNDTDKVNDGVFISPYIFNTYFDNDADKFGKQVQKAAYISRHPEPIYEPWVYDDNKQDVKELVAFPTSDIVNDPSGLYKNGYTRTILTVDEPGNGDIERYDSNQNNQLVIAAVAPGEFGNDIGISIITPEVADNLALVDQPAAFNW